MCKAQCGACTESTSFSRIVVLLFRITQAMHRGKFQPWALGELSRHPHLPTRFLAGLTPASVEDLIHPFWPLSFALALPSVPFHIRHRYLPHPSPSSCRLSLGATPGGMSFSAQHPW